MTVEAKSNHTAAAVPYTVAVGTLAVNILLSDTSVGGTTQAFVGGATTVNAPSFTVHADSTLAATSDARALSVSGIGGMGVVGTARAARTAAAYVEDGSAVSVPAGTFTLDADAVHTVNGSVRGINVAGVSVAVLKSAADLGGGASAGVGDAATVTARNVAVSATSANTVTATTTGLSVSLLGVDVLRTPATDTSLTETYLGRALSGPAVGSTITATAGAVTADAVSTGTTRATSDVTGISVVAAFNGTDTSATTTRVTRSTLGFGSSATATGAVRLSADATVFATAEGTGVGAALGIGYAGADVNVAMGPRVQAFTAGGGSLAGSSVTLAADLNRDGSGNPLDQTPGGNAPAFGKVTLGAGGLLAGAVSGQVNALTAATLLGQVGTGTQVTAGGDLSVTAGGYQKTQTDARGLSIGGVAGVGVAQLNATTGAGTVGGTYYGSSTRAAVDGSAIVGGNVMIAAFADTNSVAAGDLRGGGVVAGVNVASVVAVTTPGVSAGIGGAVTADGNITAEARASTQASAAGRGITVAIVGVDVLTTSATIAASVDAQLTGSAKAGGDLSVRALNNFTTDFQTGNLAQASVGSLNVGLGVSVTDSSPSADARSVVAAGASGTAAAGKGVSVFSRAGNYADASVSNGGGGLVRVASGDPTADARGTTRASFTGTVGTASVPAAGSVTVSTQADDRSQADLRTSGGGVVNVENSTARARTGPPEVSATLGGFVNASGDVSVTSLSSSDADSTARSSGGGVVNVQNFSATANTSPSASATVAPYTQVTAGGTLTVTATHGRPAAAGPDGTFNALGDVNPTTDTITFAQPHGLRAGDTVSYSKNGNLVAVPGLTDGRTYGVVPTSATALQLGAVLDFAPTVTATPAFTGGVVFDPPTRQIVRAAELYDPAAGAVEFIPATRQFTRATVPAYDAAAQGQLEFVGGGSNQVYRSTLRFNGAADFVPQTKQITRSSTYYSGQVTYDPAVTTGPPAGQHPARLLGLPTTNFAALGFAAGQTVYVGGSVSNNGQFTIASVVGNAINLSGGTVLTAEGVVQQSAWPGQRRQLCFGRADGRAVDPGGRHLRQQRRTTSSRACRPRSSPWCPARTRPRGPARPASAPTTPAGSPRPTGWSSARPSASPVQCRTTACSSSAA